MAAGSALRSWCVPAAMLVLLCLHGVLRSHGIAKSYPYPIYVDECYVAHRAQEMYREHTLDPRRYDYNPLLATAIDAAMRLVVLARGDDAQAFRRSIKYVPRSPFGRRPASETVASDQIVDPPEFLLVGRALVAIAGTLSIWLVYLLLRELLPAWVAVLGSAWFGAIPTLVLYSQFVVNDVPMMLAYTAVFWCSGRWWRTGDDRFIYAAGALAGAACGFKTTAVLALGLPMLCIAVRRCSLRRKLALLVLLPLLAALTFHGLCPAMIGKHREILANLLAQQKYYREAYPLVSVSSLDHLRSTQAFGVAPLVLAALGMVGALLRREARAIILIMLAYTIAFVAFFSRYTFQPVRSLLPIFPLVVLLAIHGLFSLVRVLCRDRARITHALAVGLVLALAAGFSLRALGAERTFLAGADSRIRITTWLARHVPPEHRVAVPAALALHPRAVAAAHLAIDAVEGEDRARFLAAPWVVIPAVTAAGNSGGARFFAELRAALEAEARTPVLTVGSRPITADEHHWWGPHTELVIYGPPPRGGDGGRAPRPSLHGERR
ncbi:MAG: glycosyltransferase family 39 protein [Planctomycetota bacterium]